MIDDHPDSTDPGPDPLSGRDPHPREQIDLWPLHDARQELLEEIVSQAGPGESPARTKILLSVVGIAAALALVAGGAWAVIGSDSGDGGSDDQVAASSDHPAPSDVATDPTTAQTTEATTGVTTQPSDEPRQRDDVRKRGVRIGSVRTLRRCLAEVPPADRKGEVTRLDKVIRRGKHKWKLYVVRDGRRTIAVDGDCKWIRVVPVRPRQH